MHHPDLDPDLDAHDHADHVHLAEILRRARDDPAEALRLGAKARSDMTRLFSPEILADQVRAHLVRITKLIEEKAALDATRTDL